MIAEVDQKQPKIHPSVFVANTALVVGDVEIGEDSSVWFHTVVRGDVHWIKIGSETNIQDGSVLHVTHNTYPLSIGNRVTVGHKVLLHGCTIEDNCLIGMGAIIMDNVHVGKGCLVAAGALLTPGKKFPAGHLIKGSPAKAVRELTEEEKRGYTDLNWRQYCKYAKSYRESFKVLSE